MKEQKLKRNASGYIDEPCYKAVTAPPRTGEIWLHGKSGAYMLVLANVNGVCPTMRLTEWDEKDTVPVMCKTPMYVKPCMIGYTFENLLTEYVKSVKGNEMSAVRKGLIRALGLFDEVTQDNPMPEEYKALEGALEAQRTQNMYLRTENDSLKAQLEEAKVPKTESDIMEVMQKDFNETYARLDQEIVKLTIYKDMYMDIIGKLVSVRGGAAVNE